MTLTPKPWLDDGDVKVYAGDCIDVMAAMPAESVDAVCTDPPYALTFMGRGWDAYGPAEFQAWCEQWATEALRVLKPGGHLLAFGGTRTFHRLTSGLEDAGFEIRDCLSWLYGSGFPKSLDVSKAIDKAAGAEREVVGKNPNGRHVEPLRFNGQNARPNLVGVLPDITAPATEAAAAWQGWGTALKPAWEPIVLARKPLAGTVAANVQAHGTGALNIDGCRIGTDPGYSYPNGAGGSTFGIGKGNDGSRTAPASSNPAGRWPANVVIDADAARMLDDHAGERPSGGGERRPREWQSVNAYGFSERPNGASDYHREASTGGPSRFFYTAKASTAERNNGHGPANTHPTVKPVDLMRWCIRLITPPGGTVLDPFGGSGTTGVAARAEGMRCILIEREAEYLPIIAGRLSQLSLLGDVA